MLNSLYTHAFNITFLLLLPLSFKLVELPNNAPKLTVMFKSLLIFAIVLMTFIGSTDAKKKGFAIGKPY